MTKAAARHYCGNKQHHDACDDEHSQTAGSPGFVQTEKPGSDMFCEIGSAAACMAGYPEHIAPKSP